MSHDAPIRFTDPKVQACPFVAYRELRGNSPVYKDPDTGQYIITDYGLLKKVAGDFENFSNRCGILGEIEGPRKEFVETVLEKHGYPMIDTLVSGDPPDHGFHRSLIDKVFSVGRVRRLEGYIQQVVDGYVGAFVDAGAGDFHAAVSVMVPMTVIADQLGVPSADIATFKRWSNAALQRVNPALGDAELFEALIAHTELQHYIVKKADEYRISAADCLLSDLVHAERDGRHLSREEIVSIVSTLIIAGNETTTSAISSAMLRLARDVDLQQKLREEPKVIPVFIEEMLRMDAPIQGLFRRAVVDTELAGVKIPAGSILMLRYGAANRDPQIFNDPESFDLERANVRQHVTFGFGAHFCVGSQLARGELRMVLETMLRRTLRFQLADPLKTPAYGSAYTTYGLESLSLAFDKH